MLEPLLILVGIPLLWKGADWLVDGGAALATRFGIPAFIIGLTVVSFGTSAPELFVNVVAAIRGNTDLAMGAILGSNVANVLLILGIAAILVPISVHSRTVRIEIPFTVLATLVVAVLIHDVFLGDGDVSRLGLADGLVLLAFFILFLAYVYHVPHGPVPHEATTVAKAPLGKTILLILLGLAALALGSEFLVDGSLALATMFGLKTGFIGFFIVAVGTSLPELAASIAAARKDQVDLVVGNVVGSNIFNMLWILGVTAMIHPIGLSPDTDLLLLAALLSNILLLGFLGKDRRLARPAGIAFLVAYVVFLVWLGVNAV